MKLYVKAKSKREINAAIAAGKVVVGDVYHADGTVSGMLIDNLPDLAVVVRYMRMVDGNPYGVGFHVWNAKKKALR